MDTEAASVVEAICENMSSKVVMTPTSDEYRRDCLRTIPLVFVGFTVEDAGSSDGRPVSHSRPVGMGLVLRRRSRYPCETWHLRPVSSTCVASGASADKK
jgi:hypothetical protein